VVELRFLDDFLEAVVVDAEHDAAEHLDEAAVAVPGEAFVAGFLRQAFDGFVVEAEIQHGVHHAGHRDAGAGADGDQQRRGGVAEAVADRVLDPLQRLGDLRLEGLGVGFPVGDVERAKLGRDGEAGRDRQADGGHFRQIGALAAEQVAHVGAAFVAAGAEAVDPLAHAATPSFDALAGCAGEGGAPHRARAGAAVSRLLPPQR